MFKRFADLLTDVLFKGDKKNWPAIIVFYLALLSPVILVTTLSYIEIHQDLTDLALSRRESIAYLAAATLEQRFNRLTDIAVSLASRVRFRQLIGEGKWDEAIQIMSSIPRDFPFIDRVFLSDPSGTLMADTPALPGVRGRNFALRDWYKGVSGKWEPYVSEVYKRAAEPQYNVVAVATPIRAEDERIIGVLGLQVRLDALFEWGKGIKVGPSGFAYFVDKKGRIAAHPKYPPQGEIVDYSSVPAVQKVLRGERGVAILFNPIEKEERVSGYAPVPTYGWGVIAQQPTSTAFAARNDNLRLILIVYGPIILLNCGLAYLVLYTLTKLKRIEEETHKLNTQIEAANKELEAFSYSVSHDLRAPLRAMDGFSRILLEKHSSELSPETQRYLGLVRNNAKQMGQLIDDLLAFSRLSRQPLNKQRVSPAEIVYQALKELEQEQNGRQVEISVADLPACQADSALLKQVFANLLSNALKYTRQREVSRIEVNWRQIDGGPVYFVKDNGVGFDMQYAHKLFGVFQRLHRAEDYEGTGVGLALVQRIIHRHEGRIWAEAEVNKGATFYFALGGGS